MSSFNAKAKVLMLELYESMLLTGTVGVRAQVIDTHRNLILDFSIIRDQNHLHVLNAPSLCDTCTL
jgi:L-2-hydroxyglutarate oxidase